METALTGTLEKYVSLLRQNAPATRCQAQSKRSKQKCRKAAIRGKQVCRMHGALNTGPRTSEGRKLCAAAKTVHGWETRELRRKRAEKFREMKLLFRITKSHTNK